MVVAFVVNGNQALRSGSPVTNLPGAAAELRPTKVAGHLRESGKKIAY